MEGHSNSVLYSFPVSFSKYPYIEAALAGSGSNINSGYLAHHTVRIKTIFVYTMHTVDIIRQF